jgi:hypothetical protein
MAERQLNSISGRIIVNVRPTYLAQLHRISGGWEIHLVDTQSRTDTGYATGLTSLNSHVSQPSSK